MILSKNSTLKFRIAIRLLVATISGLLFLASTQALSAIPYRTAYEEYELVNRQTKELNLSLLANIQIMVEQNKINLSRYIPLKNLPTYDDGTIISRRIFLKTLETFSESDVAALSPIVTTANKINSGLSTEIASKNTRINFQLRPLDSEARVVVKGSIDASLSYDFEQKEMRLTLTKKVGNQNLAFTHTDNRTGTIEMVGVQWVF